MQKVAVLHPYTTSYHNNNRNKLLGVVEVTVRRHQKGRRLVVIRQWEGVEVEAEVEVKVEVEEVHHLLLHPPPLGHHHVDNRNDRHRQLTTISVDTKIDTTHTKNHPLHGPRRFFIDQHINIPRFITTNTHTKSHPIHIHPPNNNNTKLGQSEIRRHSQ